MALTPETTYYLVTSTILAVFAIGYAFVMILSFIRKKTLGTAFLMATFTLLGLGEGIYAISFWLEAFEVTTTNTTGLLQALFVNLYALSIIFFYFFATRNILRDNAFVKSMMGILLGEVTAVVTTTMLAVLYLGQDLTVPTSQTITLPNTNLDIFSPTLILSIILFGPLTIFVLTRVSLNLVAIRRRITEPVPRAGIFYIGLSVLSLVGSTVTLIVFYIPAVQTISGLMIFLQAFRLVTTIARLIFGYLGWILPDWLKKRIRGKAWIVQILKEKKGIPVTYSFSSSRDIKTETIPIKEISEP